MRSQVMCTAVSEMTEFLPLFFSVSYATLLMTQRKCNHHRKQNVKFIPPVTKVAREQMCFLLLYTILFALYKAYTGILFEALYTAYIRTPFWPYSQYSPKTVDTWCLCAAAFAANGGGSGRAKASCLKPGISNSPSLLELVIPARHWSERCYTKRYIYIYTYMYT